MKRAIVFPGQGSQAVGMGKELAEAFTVAREVFEEIDDALGQKLFKLMCEGPESDLTLTENAQPALMAASMATLRVLEKEGGVRISEAAAMTAGHSLGEYSALAAAGSLDLADAARLLRLRGKSMQEAVPVGEGAMAALLGLDLDVVQGVAEEASAEGVCSVANDNAPGQVVVSGKREAVEKAVEIAKEKGARRAMMLQVSAPFHCPLLAPAADAMAEALAQVAPRSPSLPVVMNVTAAPEADPLRIVELLVQQVTGTVRWRECVQYMHDQGVEQTVELGAGKVLSGLSKRISRDLDAVNAGTPAEIETLVKNW